MSKRSQKRKADAKLRKHYAKAAHCQKKTVHK